MALDGIVIRNIVYEMNQALTDGRISRISQPEADALVLTVNRYKNTYRILISANASLPLCYFTDTAPANPMTAPAFCMLLRKHIGGGRIVSVTQPGMERIIRIGIEHLNELGDLCRRNLIIELMGKHSNIIFTDENDVIIDSIKRISSNVSSLREVLPGRDYFVPVTEEKMNPLTVTREEFLTLVCTRPQSLCKALYGALTGISPTMGIEIACRAGLDADASMQSLSEAERAALWSAFRSVMEPVSEDHFSPCIYSRGQTPVEFASLPLTSYADCDCRFFDSVSTLLNTYYAERNTLDRIRQRSADLRRITQTALERNYKKYDLQLKQMKDTEKRDTYRLYGEMLNTFGYSLAGGEKQITVPNYYDNDTELTVPLDPELTARENAQKYFDRYQKLKRTHEALTVQIADTEAEIRHLESVRTSLDIALHEEDLAEIKAELREAGYIRKQPGAGKKREKITSRPFRYISSDGFDIYVGKNNYQNEYLTFTLADSGDWWFHAKGVPGSHVIVKTAGRQVPDRTFEEAAALAAYYSSERNADKVEVDYVRRKEVRKTPGGKPGFVIYHTNYSLVARPGIPAEQA